MDNKLKEALRNIVEYLYSDERKDYECFKEEHPENPTPHHIFNDLETIKEFIEKPDYNTHQMTTKCSNCSEQVVMISSGEFCPCCFC